MTLKNTKHHCTKHEFATWLNGARYIGQGMPTNSDHVDRQYSFLNEKFRSRLTTHKSKKGNELILYYLMEVLGVKHFGYKIVAEISGGRNEIANLINEMEAADSRRQTARFHFSLFGSTII
jgi:hypothetical protein